jgi:cobalt/nickel transport system permease protein
MHMADALISPAVGIAGWAVALGAAGYSARQVRLEADPTKVPLMGVTAAFVFAAQMVNFAIPGTGSSGHLGGGLLLAVLLGPHAALLAMVSVLMLQALLFADGGLLALGCNIVNLGLCSCLVAYPLLFRRLVTPTASPRRVLGASLLAAVVASQLGAFAIVVETVLSGISALPFVPFVAVMQPIHLAIGLVEGVATAAVVQFVWKARPELAGGAATRPQPAGGAATRPQPAGSPKVLLAGLAVATLLVAGAVSWLASTAPDGLEWSLQRTSGSEALGPPPGVLHQWLGRAQERVSVLPDYAFPDHSEVTRAERHQAEPPTGNQPAGWPEVDAGTSVAGLVGSALTLAIVLLMGWAIRWRRMAR